MCSNKPDEDVAMDEINHDELIARSLVAMGLLPVSDLMGKHLLNQKIPH